MLFRALVIYVYHFFLVKIDLTTIDVKSLELTVEDWLLAQLLLKEANGNFVFNSIALKL